jgi:hypothetical protein
MRIVFEPTIAARDRVERCKVSSSSSGQLVQRRPRCAPSLPKSGGFFGKFLGQERSLKTPNSKCDFDGRFLECQERQRESLLFSLIPPKGGKKCGCLPTS